MSYPLNKYPLPRVDAITNCGEAREDNRCIRCERPIPSRRNNPYCSTDCRNGQTGLRFQDKEDQEIYLLTRIPNYDR